MGRLIKNCLSEESTSLTSEESREISFSFTSLPDEGFFLRIPSKKRQKDKHTSEVTIG